MNNKYWLNWFVDTFNGISLETYDFKIIENPNSKNVSCFIPLIWLKELIQQQKTDSLHILRTPNHRPKDPYELIKIIKQIENL